MELIYTKEMLLHPIDSKTNISLPFLVEDDYERLEIHFSYTPKELEDKEQARKYIDEGMAKYAPGSYRAGYKNWEAYLPVYNLITLSLDSPDGYVGCAHRHNPEQIHILSKTASSPGFAAQEPVHGNWQAIINVHALVTDECTCTLKIFGDSDTEVLL